MTVQTFDPSALAPATTGFITSGDVPEGVAQLVAWANTAQAAAGLVERLIDSPFVPASFWPSKESPKETAEEYAARRQVALASATAAVLYGGELGLSPLAALSAIYVVKGKPGLYAEAMVALVRSAGHEMVVEEQSAARCVIRARRKGTADWQRVEFTIDRAQKAGYARQNQKYGSDPQTMLYARCASIACRQIAPDVLKGIATVEEVLDEPDAATAPAAAGRTVQRAAARRHVEAAPAPSAAPAPASSAPAASGPPLPGEDEHAGQPAEDADAVTDAQLRKLGAVFGDLQVTGEGSRAERLRIASQIVDREITSSKDLTKREASLVIDTLSGTTRERLKQVLGLTPVAAAEQATPAAEQPAGPAVPGDDVDHWGDASPDDTDSAQQQPALPGEAAPERDPWDIP